MPKRYVVQQGDCLGKIAHRFGFADYHSIYDHPANADFKKRRTNPNVILPGDELVIPDRAAKSISLPTGTRHKVIVKRPERRLRLRLLDGEGKAMTGRAYELDVGGKTLVGKTNGDGVIEVQVGIGDTDADLRVEGKGRITLRIGHLDPVADENGEAIVSGLRARLENLGYDCGAYDGELGPLTRTAVCVFRTDQGLQPGNGMPDTDLLSALKERHGS